MKNRIKKAEMRGQFIDMQKTRGGIPARLIHVNIAKNLLARLNLPYVIGRVGWYNKNSPKDLVFFHCTDHEKARCYGECIRTLRWKQANWNLKENDKRDFQSCLKKYEFTFPKSYDKTVKELMN